VSRVNGFVVGKIIVAEFSELVLCEFGVCVVVCAVEPVLRISVPGLVVAFEVGRRDRSVDQRLPLFVFRDFVVD